MLDGFTRSSFTAATRSGHSIRHEIYTKGDQGPTVVVMQELPGIGPTTIRLADHLHDHGFRVVLPHLFGPLGRLSMMGNLARVLCMRREFRLFQKNQSSPVVDWLRALCRDLRTHREATGVGVIGMCLTGNFAISLMAEESVAAGVASQPSLPLFAQSALHLSESDIQTVRDRLDAEGPMIALRFEGDGICTAAKFAAIDRAFNDSTQRVRMVQLPGDGHSVLTRDLVRGGEPARQALDDVTAYFTAKLMPSPASESSD